MKLADLVGRKIMAFRRGDYGLLTIELDNDINVELNSDPDGSAVCVDIVEYKVEKVVKNRTTLAE